ncbi:MAG: ABC transporter ATP-binding protein [Calditrichaeota bacterium]|nr:MAG: ABC transporter ATP-binding protein [Calditrichota bacterium]
MQSVLLDIRNLTKSYSPSRSLLRKKMPRAILSVDELSLFKGEILALVGESGSGKTTFGRCLLRLVHADSGEVFYAGDDLLALPMRKFQRERRKFQMIFQDPGAALNPRQSIRQAIAEPLRVHEKLSGLALEKRLQHIFEDVQLPTRLMGRFPHEISGGQKQRVCIARALCVRPELIIADEPTANLDALIKGQILELLVSLQKKYGLTVLFITHDLFAVEQFADRIATMEMGKIVNVMPKKVDEANLNVVNENSDGILDGHAALAAPTGKPGPNIA